VFTNNKGGASGHRWPLVTGGELKSLDHFSPWSRLLVWFTEDMNHNVCLNNSNRIFLPKLSQQADVLD
jgi:hypothetical protein